MPRRLALIALVACLASPTLAQTCTTSWAAATDGNWSDASKWTAGVPDANDTACIEIAGTYTVTLDQNQALDGLMIGGASGTQTLEMEGTLSPLGSGRIAVNGRVENRTSSPCGSCDGLPSVTDTLTVEGVLVHRQQTGLLSAGGTLDVAPGGLLWIDAAGSGVSIGQADMSTLRVRGRVEATPSSTPGTTTIAGTIEIDGGTVEVQEGILFFQNLERGILRDATFEVAEGALARIYGDGREGQKTLIAGTLSGDIQGDLTLFNVALEAAPSGATLDVTGTGLQLESGAFGRRVDFDGTGGVFTNVGLVRVDIGATLRSALFHNEGAIRITQSTLEIGAAGVLINEEDGLVDLVQGGSIHGDGRLDNHGLITARREVATGTASSSFGGTLRSQPGSELQVLKGASIRLDSPGSATLPAGARLTGNGDVTVAESDFAVEGIVSPGTNAAPIDTLSLTSVFDFSRLSGSPQLVVDVDAGGRSDRLESASQGLFRPYGALVVRVQPGYTPAVGDVFTIWQGQRADQLDGAFTQVVSDGAPSGLAFVAEPNADASALLLRVVGVAPGGTIAVSETEPVGGGVRSLFLTGPGAPGIVSARLDCTECLDADAFGSISAELVGEGTLREAQFDLTSPRVYGFYDLVLSRAGLADTTVTVTVRPFLSYIVMTDALNRGIGVRPAALRYNWSWLRVWNVTNADVPGYTVAALDREDDTLVSLALATGNTFSGGQRIFEESRPEDGPTQPILAFGRIEADQSIYLNYGQRMLPEDVLFPEQTSTGPSDDRIPFGEKRLLLGLATQHASFARTRDLLVQALRDTDNNALAAYLASVDTADPGAMERAVERVIDLNRQYVEGINGVFERILDALDDSVPVPSGLETSAALAFEDALDAATGDYLLDAYEAINLDIQEAPTSVQALLESELDRLGIDSASEARISSVRHRNDGFGDTCNISSQMMAASSESDRNTIQFVILQDISERRKESTDLNVSVEEVARSAVDRMIECTGVISPSKSALPGRTAAAGSCTFPPAPPGGPTGGGGGACTPPAAPADPNDKTANSQYPCQLETVTVDGQEVTRCVRYYVPRQLATAPIVYSVQFENLPQATANAEFVTITDELDANLDPSTLEVFGTSADSVFTVEVSGQTATFRFTGIDLPPNVEQPEGQGFVTFSVQPRTGLADGTEIRNDASIVFDFNPPIATPEVVHEIREMSDLAVTVLSPDFETTDQPVAVEVFVSNLQGDDAAETTLRLELPVAANSVTVPDGKCIGTTMLTCTLGTLQAGEFTTVTLELPPSPIGNYTITADANSATFDGFLPNNRESVGLPIVGTDAEQDLTHQLSLTAGPNPSRGAVTLRWMLPETADVELMVVDLLGREVVHLDAVDNLPAGTYARSWDGDVASGVYVIWLRAGDEVRTRRVTVLR